MSLTIMIMTHEMPKLPYANNALEPVISQQTIDYHYGKHLQCLLRYVKHVAYILVVHPVLQTHVLA